jgi:hypothetical protein
MSDKPHDKSGEYLDQATWDALKAAGFSDAELYEDQPFGPVIHRYTRKQAIEDGVLVDLSRPGFDRVVRMSGIIIPTAMTSTAFARVVASELTRQNLWEALCRLGGALAELVRQSKVQGRDSDRVFFTATGVDDQPVKLWAQVGPGDTREPVMTIMLEGED